MRCQLPNNNVAERLKLALVINEEKQEIKDTPRRARTVIVLQSLFREIEKSGRKGDNDPVSLEVILLLTYKLAGRLNMLKVSRLSQVNMLKM